ncbi:hypothetical protein ACQ4LE_006816 [Meloidogyne hapla]
MDIRAKLIEVQKSRKRRLPINDSSELSDVQLLEKNLEENNEENLEANLIKFEQGVTNKGNVALWHVGYRYVTNDKNSNYWRCSNKDCPVKEALVISTLNEAEYDDDGQLLNVLTLLGLQMSGYIDGLRSTERQPEERDTEDGMDNENSESDQPSTSSSLFI